MQKYSLVTDIEYIQNRNYASNEIDALKLDDLYLTLSQLAELERNDIDRRVNEMINLT